MNESLETVYGRHSVRAVLLTRPSAVRRVVILDGRKSKTPKSRRWTDYYLELTRDAPVEPEILQWKEFHQVTGLDEKERHQGICIAVEPRTIYNESHLELLAGGRLVVVLDQITNPQNLGTILRTAGFFHVDAVILLKDRSASINTEVLRVASGGAELVKIFNVTNLARTLKTLKDLGYWIYGLDERGPATMAETDFSDPTVLVVGAEGEGLRRLTKETCDFLVQIAGGRDGVESLNAAVATSIAIAEVQRGALAPRVGGGDDAPE